jgi:hydroxymethylpyrimidine pyrophosphatase-like HAD family hydrolase
MLKLAGHSYAVENARQEVKDAADEVIGPMMEDSVLKILKGWL